MQPTTVDDSWPNLGPAIRVPVANEEHEPSIQGRVSTHGEPKPQRRTSGGLAGGAGCGSVVWASRRESLTGCERPILYTRILELVCQLRVCGSYRT